MTGVATAPISTQPQQPAGRSLDGDPPPEPIPTSGITEPRLAFDGNPNYIPVTVPETLTGYSDIRVEAITTRHPQFEELAGTYIAHVLHADNINSGNFVWPPFKLKEFIDVPDEELFEADGNMKPEIIQAVLERYLKPTIRDKGNHLLILHGTVNGEPGFIGGGLSFEGVKNEDEGWISKGVVAIETNGLENRGNGLGRALQEARIMHWMLTHQGKNHLNTGVNIEEAGISPQMHEVSSKFLRDMDVMQQLRTGETVTVDSVAQQLEMVYGLLVQQGFGEFIEQDSDKITAFLRDVRKTAGTEGFSGFTPDSVRRRKDIIVAAAGLFDVPVTATERTFLRAGAKYVNAIPNSAVVRSHPELNHTRRLILDREVWEKLNAQDNPQIAQYLAEQRAA